MTEQLALPLSTMLSGVTFQIKHLPPNPYLRVCLWGNLTKDPTFPPSLVHELEVELTLPLSWRWAPDPSSATEGHPRGFC